MCCETGSAKHERARRRRERDAALAALLDEAIAAVGILCDHNEGPAFEAGLALQRITAQMQVFVLGRNADASLGEDLGRETPRADAQIYGVSGIGEELPRVLGDEDAGTSSEERR
ncbi:MAG: hypothetical protein AUH85_03155 [Chloroflexi bacterium 13_1_40CM_4_68_4]|nr:MAG: hypothetical protein AUH85_03155 [Chloroflexi bacterium 13_1_40CM_4_68_4]